jgi:hypothetical protein
MRFREAAKEKIVTYGHTPDNRIAGPRPSARRGKRVFGPGTQLNRHIISQPRHPPLFAASHEIIERNRGLGVLL